MEMLEKIHYQAASAITGSWQGTSQNKLYEELGHNMTPTYLLGNVPRQRRLLYGNTKPNNYYEIYSHTTQYMNSFFPDTIKKMECY